MQKNTRWATVVALSLTASAAAAQGSYPHPYENGGYYDAQTWNPVSAAAAMPAVGFQMMMQSMSAAMQPMLAPFTRHPYRNEGYYGSASSDVALENAAPR
jgi:hypothetical protein